ncbi:MAG: branched-chain amino acid ABC transporter permease [Chloroflexi bacterium]|nr:branched-chain amino acid ABC transporter permease [Chloroflexota bacterium]
MKTLTSPFLWIILLVVSAVAALPIVVDSPSMREDLFLILMLAILASSVNIIMGYTGYVSFGHIVFFGLGGYLAFYLMQTYQVHLIAAALVAGVVTSLIAFGLGVPVLRLRGAYFALATIGINEAVRSFVTNFDAFGGGVGMIFNYSVYDAYGGAKNAGQLAYYAMVAVALLTFGTSFLIKKSKFGLGLMAIREDQDAAQILGIDPARAKVITFTISAFFPGLAGAIFFFKNGIIEPNVAFDLLRSIESLVMVMLGGFGTVTGPIVGATVYEWLSSALITAPPLKAFGLSFDFSQLHLAIAGLLLLLIVLFVTAGFVGWLRQRFPRVRRFLE